MALRTLPGLGLSGFWDLGDDTWKPGMDTNLQTLSALVNGSAKSRTTALPGTPSTGDIYIVVDTDPTNPNKVAIWDGASGSEAWVYLTPQIGWTFYVLDEAKNYQYTGSAWAEVAGVVNTYDLAFAATDETSAIAAGTGLISLRAPRAFEISEVRASITGACTTGTFTVDINVNGTSILSTKITIDATEKTSVTAATAAVLSSTTIADDDEITVDVDDAGDGTATGLKIALKGVA